MRKLKDFIIFTTVCLMFTTMFGCSAILEGKMAQKFTMLFSGNNFRANQRITVVTAPEDLNLYRNLLPVQFDLPEHPMVLISVVDDFEVGPWPLTPYLYSFISLRCVYKGEEGWCPITMPESKLIAVLGGRVMGYPKYLADNISFIQYGDSWRGEVVHDGRLEILMEFTPEIKDNPPIWVREKWPLDLEKSPTFNLMPPSKGPKVQVVRAVVEKNAKPVSEVTNGTVRITIAPEIPGAKLIKSGTLFHGSYTLSKDTGITLTLDK
ncbi:MAG: acetoacetate decarboxylase family protein [Proteobacteria bacterium]|nr:acetoacetate decarboxylase family protein [Pseudomonadota bacterium]